MSHFDILDGSWFVRI